MGDCIMEAFCALSGDSAGVIDAPLQWQPEQTVLCNMRRAVYFHGFVGLKLRSKLRKQR